MQDTSRLSLGRAFKRSLLFKAGCGFIIFIILVEWVTGIIVAEGCFSSLTLLGLEAIRPGQSKHRQEIICDNVQLGYQLRL